MPTVDAIYRYLRDHQAAMVDELRSYVSIESGTRDIEGVNRVGERLTAAFEELGFAVESIPESECGNHRVARRSGSGQGRLLVLIHLDTVWPRGTLSENPFRVEAGRAYGPGVLDMKGGWVVLLSALRALRHFNWDGLGEIRVFMTADEEVGSPRGRAHIEREAEQADWALVMEPARENGAVVVERGMVGAMYLTVHGRTAHTVVRERGASAIAEAAHKILALEALNDPTQGVLVTVGTIEGGSARQVVPDRVHLSIDLRAPRTEVASTLVARVQEIAEHCQVPGTSSTLTGGITRPAFERSPASERLLELAQACGREVGLKIPAAATRAGSDGNFTAALGVPTLDGLGPDGANTCSRDEYVVVDSLPRRAAILAGLIAGLPALPR